MHQNKFTTLLTFALLSTQTLSYASWQDMGKNVLNSLTTTQNSTATTNSSLSSTEISSGLKEALKQGVTKAVTQLGKENGYLNNPVAKIPLPQSMQTFETAIRKIGGEKYADDLIKAMNDSASQAAGKTTNIFMDAITSMNITDATKILNGNENAATQYFKTNTLDKLKLAIKPIVENSMKDNQLATYYKTFNEFYQSNGKQYVNNSTIGTYAKSFKLDSFLPQEGDANLEEYVTNKAIDGLFSLIEAEEKAIRENPIEQTSSLLKKIFSK